MDEFSLFEEKLLSLPPIHIGMTKRNGKKVLTTVDGLGKRGIDLEALARQFRRSCNCSSFLEDTEKGKIIVLTGDHRQYIETFLIKEKIATKKEIILHGC